MNVSEEYSVRRFYDDAEIFITGASGFIGKVLIEKLLRSCPRIKKIYILLRPKRNFSTSQRIQQLTESMLFEKLKEQDSEALNKLQPIEGDVMELNLGISLADAEKLKSCTVLFHAAASVRFDDPLKSAILLNTRGTREVCKLALTMPNLKALVHVSTAFVNPKYLCMEEKIYPAEADWKTYIKYAENCSEELINYLTLKLTKFAPNTYTFTKQLAEHVCVEYRNEFKLPISIIRPSIVSVTEVEPFMGWCDNLNGPMNLAYVSAFGLLHVIECIQSFYMNVVPVDTCVKGMILTAWKMSKNQQDEEIHSQIPVYNAASIKQFSFMSMKADLNEMVRTYPTTNMVGLPGLTRTTCVYYAWIVRILRQLIPALIFDGILKLLNKKPRIMKLQRIIFLAGSSMRFFYTRSFNFVNLKFVDLSKSIPEHEKDEFALTEKVAANKDLYFASFNLTRSVLFHETPADEERAKKIYPFMFAFVRIGQAIFIFAALKLLFGLFIRNVSGDNFIRW